MVGESEEFRPFVFEHKDKYGKNYKRMKYAFILIGAFWTFSGAWEILTGGVRFFHFVLLIGGPLFIVQAIISEKTQRDRYIRFDSNQIAFKQSWRKESVIKWSDLKLVHIENLAINLMDNTGINYTIRLGEYQYSEVQNIKEQIRRFAEFMEISIS